jgi:hypothetical protein
MDLGKDTGCVITQSRFRRLKLRKHSNRNRDIPIRDIPTTNRIVWGHKGQRGGQVAYLIGVSQREVPKHLHQDSRSHEVRNPDRGDGTLNSQLARASEFRHIEILGSVNQVA